MARALEVNVKARQAEGEAEVVWWKDPFIDPEDQEFKETIKNARKKLETSVAPAMPCKIMKNCGSSGSDKNTTKFACILEADESTRMRMGNSIPHQHQDHIAGKGDKFSSTRNSTSWHVEAIRILRGGGWKTVKRAQSVTGDEEEDVSKMDMKKTRLKHQMLVWMMMKMVMRWDPCSVRAESVTRKHHQLTRQRVRGRMPGFPHWWCGKGVREEIVSRRDQCIKKSSPQDDFITMVVGTDDTCGSCETIGVECKRTRGGCESNRNLGDIIESATSDNAEWW